MDFPKRIRDFMLHSVGEEWQYRGRSFASAEYVMLGNTTRIEIRCVGAPDGRQSFDVEIRGACIRGIPTLEEAAATVDEIISGNSDFCNSYLYEKLGSSQGT